MNGCCQALPDCDRPLRTLKYCNGHHQQFLKGKPFKPLRNNRPVKVCAFDGCKMAGVAAGWCATHRKQVLTRNETWDIGTRVGKETSAVIDRGDGTSVVVLSNAPLAECVIDSVDAGLVSGYRWFRARSGYAQASPRTRESHYKLWMHRVILGITGSGRIRQTDHINGNRLDNRRCNLREVTPAENAQNAVRPARRRVRGVYFDSRAQARRRPWFAKVQVNYVTYSSGMFETMQEAVEAARQLRAKHLTHHVEDRHV